MSAPDARKLQTDPMYITALLDQIKARRGLSRRAIAARIGIGYSTLKGWQAGTASWRYPDQYTLEQLAAEEAPL